ncbi:putative DNA ligase I [Trypanosoma cruzi]|uniref:Putative DNA ligase I n=1 Tax=Trypanosoma cruzi TaxID=5693 RepID=A0A2V2WFR0_TRYCR|nr:putative DNA ligase I [Trypanosoma cruzi]
MVKESGRVYLVDSCLPVTIVTATSFKVSARLVVDFGRAAGKSHASSSVIRSQGAATVLSSEEKPDVWLEASNVWEVKAADLSISPVHFAAYGLWIHRRGSHFGFRALCVCERTKRPMRQPLLRRLLQCTLLSLCPEKITRNTMKKHRGNRRIRYILSNWDITLPREESFPTCGVVSPFFSNCFFFFFFLSVIYKFTRAN